MGRPQKGQKAVALSHSCCSATDADSLEWMDPVKSSQASFQNTLPVSSEQTLQSPMTTHRDKKGCAADMLHRVTRVIIADPHLKTGGSPLILTLSTGSSIHFALYYRIK